MSKYVVQGSWVFFILFRQTLSSASLKFVTPLPFLRGDSWLRSNTRAHLFCDYGALAEPSGDRLTLAGLLGADGPRMRCLSVGAGLAVRLGEHGRAEVNYCYPVAAHPASGMAGFRGLQFGLGVTFL